VAFLGMVYFGAKLWAFRMHGRAYGSSPALSFAKIKRGPRFRQESPGIVGKVADVVMVERGSRRKI